MILNELEVQKVVAFLAILGYAEHGISTVDCAKIFGNRPGQSAYEICSIKYRLQPFEFRPLRFKDSVLRRQSFKTLLFYCALYTYFSGGSTDAVAHHVRFARIKLTYFYLSTR